MKSNATGFTLIEVLVAVIVLAIGLLGLAGLQATSLRNNQSAYNRSQATQLASDMADKLRTNVAGLNSYTSITPVSSATAKANCLTTTGCTPDDLAENDLYEWNLAVTNTLPSGNGSLTRTFAGEYRINITWDDDRDGDVDNDDPNFQTSFQL